MKFIKTSYLKAVIAVFVLIFLILLFFYSGITSLIIKSINGTSKEVSLSDRGLFGDSFGFLSAITNLFSAILLLLTLYYQKLALQKQIEDSNNNQISNERKESINFVVNQSNKVNEEKNRIIFSKIEFSFKRLQNFIQTFSIKLKKAENINEFTLGEQADLRVILKYDNFTSLLLNSIRTTEIYLNETTKDENFRNKCLKIYVGNIGKDVFINYLRIATYLRILIESENYNSSFNDEEKFEIASFKSNVSAINDWFVKIDSK